MTFTERDGRTIASPDSVSHEARRQRRLDTDEYVYEALRAGAIGFLVKDLPDHELIAGVRAAASGDTTLAPSVIRRLIATYTRRPPNTTLPPGADELTPRELEVWRLLAKGLSNTEIASANTREATRTPR